MAAPVAAAGGAAAGKAVGSAGTAGAAQGAGGKAAGLGGRLGRLGAERALEGSTSGERRQRAVVVAVALVAGLLLIVTILLQPLDRLAQAGSELMTEAFAEGAAIPTAFVPIYEAAAAHYDVNPFLLAAIHRQESDFGRSSLPGVSSSWNGCGAAGPMQMGIVGLRPYGADVRSCPNPNGAGATWDAHKNAFRPLADVRAALRASGTSYPLDRARLDGCRQVPDDVGCVYDSFDAIAAAAHKLKADGADESLYSEGTRQAVCRYIGSCSEVDSCTGGPNQYCQVLPRAREWERTAEAMAVEVRPAVGGLVSYGGRGELAWPTPPEHRAVTSGFGWRRHPVYGSARLHEGIDVDVPTGTPIAAAAAGRVTHACRDVPPCSGYGNFLCVQHEPRLSTCYAHLLRFAAGISVGAPVRRGEVIALSDSTGVSTGAHLHFEVRRGRYPATPVDPLPLLTSRRRREA